MTNNHSTHETSSNVPVHRENFGAIACAVWQNENTDGDVFYAATFSRTYRDPDTGDWRDSQAFGARDLLAVAHVAERAAQHMESLTRADRRNGRPPENGSSSEGQDDAVNENGDAGAATTSQPSAGLTADRQRTR